jgi:glutathione S-transferase
LTIVLHHYPESLFSEKIRALLGYHDLDWGSVTISNTMPRPLLMPMSGGYRKTPVLQIDANVYCDTRVIARGLARHTGDGSLFEAGFPANRVADWADTTLFQLCVVMNFRPEALGDMMSRMSEADIARFQKDRAELSGGAPIASLPAAAAAAGITEALVELDLCLAGRSCLFGDALSIADFAVYHCLWFLRNNTTNAPLVTAHGNVERWMGRIAAIGHGRPREMTGEAALDLCREAQPVVPDLASAPGEGVALGDRVTVTPVDYGRIPVEGELVARSAQEVAIRREDPQAGSVIVHFPATGFEVARLD